MYCASKFAPIPRNTLVIARVLQNELRQKTLDRPELADGRSNMSFETSDAETPPNVTFSEDLTFDIETLQNNIEPYDNIEPYEHVPYEHVSYEHVPMPYTNPVDLTLEDASYVLQALSEPARMPNW
jgi:hypothetical protein